MTTTKTRPSQEKLSEVHERLVQQLEALRTSEDWAAFLRFAAKFHSYSARNTLLILNQRPSATRVASFTAWRSMGRQVPRPSRRKCPQTPTMPVKSTFKSQFTTPRRWTESSHPWPRTSQGWSSPIGKSISLRARWASLPTLSKAIGSLTSSLQSEMSKVPPSWPQTLLSWRTPKTACHISSWLLMSVGGTWIVC